jgi:hypothetical protein
MFKFCRLRGDEPSRFFLLLLPPEFSLYRPTNPQAFPSSNVKKQENVQNPFEPLCNKSGKLLQMQSLRFIPNPEAVLKNS